MEKSIVTEELRRVMTQIWEMTLHQPLSEEMVIHDPPFESELLPEVLGDSLSCSIRISGAWSGVLCLCFSAAAKQGIARSMFHLSGDETPKSEQIEDSIKEIANMAAGNLKTVLPEPCDLGLPTLSNEEDFVDFIKSNQPLLGARFSDPCGPFVTYITRSSN